MLLLMKKEHDLIRRSVQNVKEAVTTKAEARQELFTSIKSGGFTLRSIFARKDKDKEKEKEKERMRDRGITTTTVDSSPMASRNKANAIFGVDLSTVLRRYSRK